MKDKKKTIKTPKAKSEPQVKAAETTQACTCGCGCGCNGKCHCKAKTIVAVISLIVAVCLILGAFCGMGKCNKQLKLAVVDLDAVVLNSPQVRALKVDQTTKAQELAEWLQNAEKEVNSTKDAKKKDELLKKYHAELSAKREENNRHYSEQLRIVDANITQIIVTEAQKLGYNFVMAKANVLFGGDDITLQVIKAVK